MPGACIIHDPAARRLVMFEQGRAKSTQFIGGNLHEELFGSKLSGLPVVLSKHQ